MLGGVVVGLGGAAGLAYWATRLLYRRTRHLRNAAQLRERFFHAATVLVEAGETPAEVVDRLRAMADHIADPAVGWTLLRHAVTGELRDAVEMPSDAALRVSAAVAQMPVELRAQVSSAVASFLLAASFNNYLLGSPVRRLILYWLGVPAPAEVILSRVEVSLLRDHRAPLEDRSG